MTNEVLEIIRTRRSVRAYQAQPVTRTLLQCVAEAGQYAPHAEEEAWHFTVIQSGAMLERLNRLAKQAAIGTGLPWQEELGRDENFHSTHNAPAVILVSAEENDTTAASDTAAATQTMLLAARSLGLGSCWGYFVTQAFMTAEGDALKAELGIPADYKVYTSVMLGHPAAAPAAPPRKPGVINFVD